tara:strand:- start:8482 stop:8922 length:441 start_codon:yes stop_codon:yes gene_type:complete
MPNTKPVGVAFSDPELVAGTTITGATISSSTIASGTLTNTSVSVDVAKPAAAGSTRADATALTASFSWVTGADATKGVVLPAPTAGRLVVLKNDDTANAVLKVYAPGSAKINGVAGSTAFSMAAKTACWFVAYDATDWFSVPLVAS